MILFVNDFEALPGHMGIDLGGGDVYVAQHDLYRPQVSTAFQKMTGKRVPQGVGCDIFADAGPLDILPQQFPESLAGQGFSCPSHKKIGADMGL